MSKETISRGNFSTNAKCEDKSPKVNRLHHANAHENFSCQDKFLTANFLFSCPTQKPSAERMLRARPLVCNVQRFDSVQKLDIDKAWKVLSSLQVASRNHVKPGLNDVLQNDAGHSFIAWASDISSFKGRLGTSSSACANSLPQSVKVDTNSNLGHGSARDTRTSCSSYSALGNDHSFPDNDDDSDNETFLDAMDADGILKNIDVDQIVLAHHQATSTPDTSVSKISSFTPAANGDKVPGPSGNIIPPELCGKCNHDTELALCPEAKNYLQEMKDELIVVSNRLLDDADNLSPQHFEELHLERLMLNKKIQLQEKYLQSSTQGEQSQRSHISLSTAASQSFQPLRLQPVHYEWILIGLISRCMINQKIFKIVVLRC